jgi:hypothetical protein
MMLLPGGRVGGSLDARMPSSIPSSLRPLVRAYLLGYATAVGPRLLTLLLQFFTSRKPKHGRAEEANRQFARSLAGVLRSALGLRRFPAFCAFLVGGSTLLEV